MSENHPLTGDYGVVCALIVLQQAQRDGNHKLFSSLLGKMWRQVESRLMPGTHDIMPVVLLSLYFNNRGDIAKSLAQYEQVLADTVGYDRHLETVLGIRALVRKDIDRLTETLVKQFNGG